MLQPLIERTLLGHCGASSAFRGLICFLKMSLCVGLLTRLALTAARYVCPASSLVFFTGSCMTSGVSTIGKTTCAGGGDLSGIRLAPPTWISHASLCTSMVSLPFLLETRGIFQIKTSELKILRPHIIHKSASLLKSPPKKKIVRGVERIRWR